MDKRMGRQNGPYIHDIGGDYTPPIYKRFDKDYKMC